MDATLFEPCELDLCL